MSKHEEKTATAKARRLSKQKTQAQEDTVFEGLIKQYTKARKWEFLEDLFYAYGEVLEDREKELANV